MTASTVRSTSLTSILVGAAIAGVSVALAGNVPSWLICLVMVPYAEALTVWVIFAKWRSAKAAQQASAITSALLALATAVMYLPIGGSCMDALIFVAGAYCLMLGVPIAFGLAYLALSFVYWRIER